MVLFLSLTIRLGYENTTHASLNLFLTSSLRHQVCSELYESCALLILIKFKLSGC